MTVTISPNVFYALIALVLMVLLLHISSKHQSNKRVLFPALALMFILMGVGLFEIVKAIAGIF